MRILLLTTLLIAALAAPAAAVAADTVVVADSAAQRLTALDGAIVWVTGEFGAQTLMQRAKDGTTSPVKGAPTASTYNHVDLGLDREGRLGLTYQRCDTPHRCKALHDDLRGHRSSFKNLTIKGCQLSGAVSQWRSRVAYGLFCRKGGRYADDKRSGLYVKSGSAAPRRLALPKDAARFHISGISSVDLRGTQVAAIASDVYEYAYSQSVAGRGMRSLFAASSEGETDGDARGLAQQSTSTFWTLATEQHLDDPLHARVMRQQGGCLRIERLISPPGVFSYRATDLAVDGDSLLLIVPGTGIVEHEFVPDSTPRC